MRTKCVLFALALVALLLQLGSAVAAPSSGKEVGVRWEGLADSNAANFIVRNLSDREATAWLESAGDRSVSETLSLAAGGVAELPAAQLGAGVLRLRSDADLFVLQGPSQFDAGATEIEVQPEARFLRVGKQLRVSVTPPEWAAGLLTAPALTKGSHSSAALESSARDAHAEIAVSFLARNSSVRIRLLDARGNDITSLVASSSIPMRWHTSLGALPQGSSRVEVEVLRGKAQANASAVRPGPVAKSKPTPVIPPPTIASPTGYFSDAISWSWSGDLYYSVAGAPANTYGTLWTYRNSGPWTSTGNWLLTDGSGNATKGPWSWANQANDETAYAYIEFPSPYGTTNVSSHIWDKTCATTTVTSSNGSPPSSFYGAASDATWGAGFNSNWTWGACWFQDTSSGLYWTPVAGSYSTSSNFYQNPSISGMPGMTITWSCSVPPTNVHTVGHCYQWTACFTDGSCGYCDSHSFCT